MYNVPSIDPKYFQSFLALVLGDLPCRQIDDRYNHWRNQTSAQCVTAIDHKCLQRFLALVLDDLPCRQIEDRYNH